MEKFLKYLIEQLVDNKEAVEIQKKEENSVIFLTISVAKEDMGKVIGKEGKVINSIRNLVKILAVKEKVKVVIQLAEPQE